ncbi:recombinase family protein [Streptomyces sp. NBC_00989]|uniref:recombinase family protein n=1 Tax=Streptomyces sp. NBC_00989 TaxID=2903705 RepID=UPI00386489F5|nr:recombinase family protein [Streptomyces sp. NBC_00989]
MTVMATAIAEPIVTEIYAGVYGRQSERRQNKSEASTATQHTAGIAEAKRRGAVRIELYEDLGISAFTGVERPDFERLLSDCRAGKINLLIVYYISRLSRMDPLDAIPIVTELLNLGVTIVSVTEGTFRKGNLMDLIHMFMRLDAAHNDSKNKSDAVLDAKKTARELGGYLGGKPPYGFKLVPEARTVVGDDGKERIIVIQLLEHEITEITVIQAVWATIKLYRDLPYTPGPGKHHPGSKTGICVQLNVDRVATRGQTVGKEEADSEWDPKTLDRILRDPRIAGYAVDIIYKIGKDGRKTSTIDEYRIKRDPETMEPIIMWEPIIPPAEWHELQEWLNSRGRGKGLSRGKALLTSQGILFCECGKPKKSHRDAKPYKSAYRCSRTRGLRKPEHHEGDCTISQQALDDYVARRIFAIIQTAEHDPETADVIAEATRRFGKRSESPERAGERNALVARRNDAEQALETLYDDRQAGGYSGDVGRRRFLREEQSLNSQVETTQERLTELEAAETPALPIGQWLPKDPKSDPIGEGSWWDKSSVAERQEFVTLFIEKITVFKSESKRRNQWTGSEVAERVTLEFVQPKNVASEVTPT